MANPNDPKCGCQNSCMGHCEGGVCKPNGPLGCW
jgi:hypothetical protein